MITFAELRAANLCRRGRWHGPDTEPWTGADWSNAMLGEVGEVAEVFALFVARAGLAGNVVKKLRRHETGTASTAELSPAQLLGSLADELADVVTYADILACHYGIDLGAAVAAKFNRVSERHGYPDRLPS